MEYEGQEVDPHDFIPAKFWDFSALQSYEEGICDLQLLRLTNSKETIVISYLYSTNQK